ncbi:hypothetical protein B0H63DRAFT_155605 [Podospora didyma]|uniref:C2H2-type domain-containing protein n=1 Tax=Podospora didyma TaxID=330526 RepID=A0AAE0U1N3_9PEZI|nr:hypothetical protein B0H63DRAFT_155605 [Podospora didyma]
MDCYESGNLPPAESLLSRRKKEIVAKSMAIIVRGVNEWLDNPSSEFGKSRGKRVRDEQDSGIEDHDLKGNTTGCKKKRANGRLGRRFACPFCKHNPTEYKDVKTCCGPGWIDVHRVKEHVYRRHSLKGVCPRCFKHFEKEDDLKQHQRAKVPCDVLETGSSDVITDDKAKKLHMRAKNNQSQEEKWQEMYKIIFPDAKTTPSPYYDGDDLPKCHEKSRFRDENECKEYLRKEVPRLAKAILEKEVDEVMQTVQNFMDRRANDIVKNVQTQVLRTLQFQVEQSASPAPSPSADEDHPSTPKRTLNEFLDDLSTDPLMYEIFDERGAFNMESVMSAGPNGHCNDTNTDSGYSSNSTDWFPGDSLGGTGVGVSYPFSLDTLPHL